MLTLPHPFKTTISLIALVTLIALTTTSFAEAPLSLMDDYTFTLAGQGDLKGYRSSVGTNIQGYEFHSIPYADSLTPTNRFRLPTTKSRWTGTLNTQEWAPHCPQFPQDKRFQRYMTNDPNEKNYQYDPKFVPIGPGEQPETPPYGYRWGSLSADSNEDCLKLAVWTPNMKPTKLKAVMVWFHGGGFTVGGLADTLPVSGLESIKLYNGRELAKTGDVVVVTINYRLGILGNLVSPGLSAEGQSFNFLGRANSGKVPTSGNYWAYDAMLALQWVKTYINQFGGDPNNVTLFGESAGASIVCGLLASPLASGLFHKAILESQLCESSGLPARESLFSRRIDDIISDIKSELGASAPGVCQVPSPSEAQKLACLRALPEKNIDLIIRREPRQLDYQTGLQGGGIAIDGGYFMKDKPLEVFAAGKHHQVPILWGHNSREFHLFNTVLTQEYIDGVLKTFFADSKKSEAIQEHYLLSYYAKRVDPDATGTAMIPWPIDSSPLFDKTQRALVKGSGSKALDKEDWVRMITDYKFICPTQRSLNAVAPNNGSHPVYYYVFDWSPEYFWGALGESLGGLLQPGAHGSEIPFVFHRVPGLAAIYTENDKVIAGRVSGAWTGFAKTGNPNHGSGQGWKPYSPSAKNYFKIGQTPFTLGGTDTTPLKNTDYSVGTDYRAGFCSVLGF